MAYRIDTNIPVPKSNPRAHYPFADMEVGHSFLIECSNTDEAQLMVKNRLRSPLYAAQKKYGHKYIVAPVKGGIRVWRYS